MTEQDKQALIEYYCNRDCGHTREECCLDNCHEIMLIEEFPITPTDTDTISRQAAIDAVNAYLGLSAVSRTIQNMTNIQEILERLPSAQPEIIQCQNCESYQTNFHWCKLHDGEFSLTDFCSFAERRTDEA